MYNVPNVLKASPSSKPPQGCCHSKGTWNCCVATAVFGVIFLVLGIVVLLVGEPLPEQKVEDSMAIEPNSDRLRSWLMPPVQVLICLNIKLFHSILLFWTSVMPHDA